MNAWEHRSGASAPAVTLITSFFAIAGIVVRNRRAEGARVSWARPRAHIRSPLKEHPVELFFEILLVLVAVGVLAFAGLTVKKLYQGQR
ncbi:hypothetical protein GCM10010256_37900 [Streptomyces coeruleorubidus]|uniref:Uncharacterized protein n=1 Tax=Streptomyces coeruleofuscus TaxID=66879 RepID=A0ABP5VV35_9ACTN|nr:hypothetical protein GCM10010256_37900 [Streptomyces coeruleorubidus]